MTKIKKIRAALYLLLIVQVALSAIFLAHKYSVAVDSNNIKELTVQGIAKQKTYYLRGTFAKLEINDVPLWCHGTTLTVIPSCSEYVNVGEIYTVKTTYRLSSSEEVIFGVVIEIRNSAKVIFTKNREIAIQEHRKSLHSEIESLVILLSMFFLMTALLIIKFGYNNFERNVP